MPERLHPRVPMQRMVTVGRIEAKPKFKFSRKRKFKRPQGGTHRALPAIQLDLIPGSAPFLTTTDYKRNFIRR